VQGEATGWMNMLHPMLEEGSQGGSVTHLQHLLDVEADGIFGPKTEEAVIQRQTQEGILVDGICGDETWGHLHPQIKQGDSGVAVGELQRSLQGLITNNEFGPRTHDAVVAYQRRNDLLVDGICGAETWEALCKDPGGG
jgi:peptidoglycan hydrolase-like protein with peptidoglycan-binding domain